MEGTQLFGKFIMRLDVEVVIPLLPEVRRISNQPAGDALHEGFDCHGELVRTRFAQQRMHMAGHDDLYVDADQKCEADALEGGSKTGLVDGSAKLGR